VEEQSTASQADSCTAANSHADSAVLLGPRGNQHAESGVMHDAFDHCGKRLMDGVKALSNKVGGRRLSRPNEIAVPEVRYVSDVVTRWRRHPPEIGITILLPNMNLFHQALLLVSGDFGTSPFCWHSGGRNHPPQRRTGTISTQHWQKYYFPCRR
jgi:hypothetical protein